MALTLTAQAQQHLLARLDADYRLGLTSEVASRRREDAFIGGLNNVRSPIDCPKWVCCLLPCIGRVPSMKQFRLVQPEDAEVLRDALWIRYDHTSLVVGDIVRLVEGDVVPADCAVLSLGMDHADEDADADTNDDGPGITVDAHLVTGEAKPRHISCNTSGAESTTLYYGSRVLEGACIAVVTATGKRVVLAKLIADGRWPPPTDLAEEVEEMSRLFCEDPESGIALTSIS